MLLRRILNQSSRRALAPLSGLALAVLLPLAMAGCATQPQTQACGPMQLRNASSGGVEQVFLRPTATADWGSDLAGHTVLPGQIIPLAGNAAGNHDLRVVWSDGRAAEIHGVGTCQTPRFTVQDSGLRADP